MIVVVNSNTSFTTEPIEIMQEDSLLTAMILDLALTVSIF